MAKQNLYSVRQAASLLNCTLKYVRDLLYEGKLQGKKERNQWQIDAGSLEILIQKRSQK